MSEVQLRTEAVQEERNEAHYAIHFANRALVKRDWSDPRYVAGRAALDELMLVLTKAKWVLGAALGNHDGYISKSATPERDLAHASRLFRRVTARGEQIKAFLEGGDALPAFDPEGRVDTQGTEIKFFDDAPVVPSVCPIVVLEGSNYAMGRQYAQQVLDIFGPFIFSWHSEQEYTAEQRAEIGRWTALMEETMPEVVEFARGWADGASDRGVPMNHDQALAIWVGAKPPNTDARPTGFGSGAAQSDDVNAIYMGGGGLGGDKPLRPAEQPSKCSGACAWADGTIDGKLVMGATQDHDATFQATIVAYPDRGNAFIYTPFSPNGWIPALGLQFMGGHPGINNKGVDYVHHAGANGGEPVEEWGYGIRRGASTFHLLQFADTAQQARDAIMSYPVGDAGTILGSVGGMWADSNYGIAFEIRAGAPNPEHPVVRETTFDRAGKSYNFLYANNNAISPDSGGSNSAPTPDEGICYQWELEAGWFTTDPAVMASGSRGQRARRTMSKDSAARNRYLHRMLLEGYGRIDLDYMSMVYRQSVDLPEGDHDEVVRRYNAGEEWQVSTAHRANAITNLALPRNGDDGVYLACVGPANRAVNVRMPGHGYYYHDETAAFWEITLAQNPENLVRIANDLAQERIGTAGAALDRMKGRSFAGLNVLEAFLEDARKSAAEGAGFLTDAMAQDGDARLANISRALRRFTRAQVRANQVKEAIDPPACSPATLLPRDKAA